MKLKSTIAAAAFGAIMVAGTSASAVTTRILDSGLDGIEFSALAGPLTLDSNAIDTVDTFDEASSKYAVLGGGTETGSFTLLGDTVSVISFGNLVRPSSFSLATLTVDGTVIDLIEDGNKDIWVDVESPFVVEYAFVGDGTWDIVIEAVPVPAGALLMGTALAGFGVMRRRKKKS